MQTQDELLIPVAYLKMVLKLNTLQYVDEYCLKNTKKQINQLILENHYIAQNVFGQQIADEYKVALINIIDQNDINLLKEYFVKIFIQEDYRSDDFIKNLRIEILKNINDKTKQTQLLILLGKILINIDPDLILYKNKMLQDENVYVMQLLNSENFVRLVLEDETGLIIHPDDIMIYENEIIRSGFSITKFYLISLKDKLNNLGLKQVILQENTYRNANNGELIKFKLLDLENRNDGKDLLKLLNGPPSAAYFHATVMSLLKPLGDLLTRRNELISNNVDVITAQWDQNISNDIHNKSKEQILDLLLYYTQKASSNRTVGGLGAEYDSNPEFTYKLSKLFVWFWEKILSDQERVKLMQCTSHNNTAYCYGRNSGFILFFEMVTWHGRIFNQQSLDLLYTQYSKRTGNITINCLNEAQRELSVVLDRAKNCLTNQNTLINTQFVNNNTNNNTELETINKKINAFKTILDSANLDNATKFGFKIVDNMDAVEMLSLYDAITHNHLDIVDHLCNNINNPGHNLDISNELLYELDNNIETLSPEMIKKLHTYSNIWKNYQNLNIFEYTMHYNTKVPHVILKSIANNFNKKQALNNIDLVKNMNNTFLLEEFNKKINIFFYKTNLDYEQLVYEFTLRKPSWVTFFKVNNFNHKLQLLTTAKTEKEFLLAVRYNTGFNHNTKTLEFFKTIDHNIIKEDYETLQNKNDVLNLTSY